MTSKGIPYIESLYQQPHRHYHNLKHIHECHWAMEKYFGGTRNPRDLDIVSSVLWFHDVVYDPTRNDNEEQSAAMAKTWIESGLWADYEGGPQRVADLILLTKTHTPNSDPLAPVVLDIDLSILAESPARFADYEVGIRKEYAWVPAGVYAKARIAILESLAKRERIYLTPEMQVCEGSARYNLGRSLEHLHSLL